MSGLLDPASFTPLGDGKQRTTLIAGGGRLEGEPVWIAATDPSRARGALGAAEGDLLCNLFQTARNEPRPLLLLLDSAGAKVDEGLVALGAFRRLFREAVLTRLAQVPMLGLLGKSCFGGASMLACVCALRVHSTNTLLAVSGPGVIEALGGKGELDAADPAQVRALMGGDARARLAPSEQLVTDSLGAFRDSAVHFLHQGALVNGTVDLTAEHSLLGGRLTRRNVLSDVASAGAASFHQAPGAACTSRLHTHGAGFRLPGAAATRLRAASVPWPFERGRGGRGRLLAAGRSSA